MLDNTQTFTAEEMLLISQLRDKFTKMHVAQLIASKQLRYQQCFFVQCKFYYVKFF